MAGRSIKRRQAVSTRPTRAGHLAPWQALETATSLAAKTYGLSNDLGTLTPGHLADLIIVAGD
ncbi:amidohydrolase family protein [Edaphobacter aggregans]|uniref:amidohydrolase family protein n=1 Tax=Edaphobacter aggregans TaxID=570835 RepID=UPI0005539BB7|nr:amidohydrolase family protein [Edaphobacter aggregans]